MYYAYVLRNPLKNNLPFYVGKGSGQRVSFHIKSAAARWKESYAVNPHKSNTINQILREGLQVTVEVFICDTEIEAFQKEKELIAEYGLAITGGALTNLTYGGEGYSRPGIAVDQYTMFGEYITSYASLQEASISVTGNQYSKNGIKQCCDGERRSCKGFRWAFKGEALKLTQANKRRGVRQYNAQGILIASYPSINNAAVVNNYDSTTIYNACKTGKLSYGYKWVRLES